MSNPVPDEDKLVSDNLNLVHFVIQKKFRVDPKDYDYEDIFQTGCMGLLYGIRKFKPNKGCKLSTYAALCIGGYVEHYFRAKKATKNGYNAEKVSFDAAIYQGDSKYLTLADATQDMNNGYDVVDSLLTIEQSLNDAEKQVVSYRRQGYKQPEIGRMIGRSQVQVSRIERMAHSKLREVM